MSTRGNQSIERIGAGNHPNISLQLTPPPPVIIKEDIPIVKLKKRDDGMTKR